MIKIIIILTSELQSRQRRSTF